MNGTVIDCLGCLNCHVMSEEFSQCYDDVNVCLWTDGSLLTQSEAQSACQQRNSFLPRITNNDVQSKLAEFRFTAGNLLSNDSFWIDVKAVDVNNWHWLDGSSFVGLFSCYNSARENVQECSLSEC